MKPVALVFLLTMTAPALAQDTVFGIWCDEGWGPGIEPAGMGDFEHTICSHASPQPAGRSLSTPMICRVYHDQDDGTAIETATHAHDLTATLIDDDTIAIDYNDGRGAFDLSRCENQTADDESY